MKIINPANQKLLHELTDDSPAQVEEKFYRAHRYQATWRAVELGEKIKMIARFRDLLKQNQETLAKTLTEEVGKPLAQSHNELNGLTGRIDFFLEKTPGVLRDEVVHSDTSKNFTEKIAHEPLGTVVNISAWNYPYFVGANAFVPALLTGNCVLYKPSEFSSLTGLAIERLLHEAGIPKDAFQCIVGTGAAGAQLLKLPINGVFFTGSYATGKKIAEAVAGRMIHMQLELGGKDPAYICEDVDVAKAAASTADGAMYNTGQSCCSVERIYVHEKIFDTFIKSFLETVATFKAGDPMDPNTYIGPLTRGALQIEVLQSQVEDAVKKGAKLLTGGQRSKAGANYFEPTVLVNVNHTMDVMREESFGPIIGIQKVQSDDEALRLMNDTPYGLTAGVYTKDRVRAERILSKVQSGSVYWNCCDRVSPRLPWSGRGHSGVGTTLSTYGILAFTQLKAWHLNGG